MVNDGVARIKKERERQIEKEGWTPEHDAKHTSGQLKMAAVCYLYPHLAQEGFPWSEEWWKPGDKIRNLEKAGALLAAEIDRLIAKEKHEQEQSE